MSGKRKSRKHTQSALERRWQRAGPSTDRVPLPSASDAAVGMAGYQASQALFDPMVGRFGARKFRRWANERLLRELSGPLTAGDMQLLFNPVPFGDMGGRTTLFQEISSPEVCASGRGRWIRLTGRVCLIERGATAG